MKIRTQYSEYFFREIICEKLETLQRIYGLLMATISLCYIDCTELKIAQLAQIYQLFQLVNSICAYGDTFYGLTRTG